MINLHKALELIAGNQSVVKIDSNNPVNAVVLTLESGATLTFSPNGTKPVAVETHTVAYFSYPSSGGVGCNYSRRVILAEPWNYGDLCGWETTNESDYQFKTFKTARIVNNSLHFQDEPITAEDRKHLKHL